MFQFLLSFPGKPRPGMFLIFFCFSLLFFFFFLVILRTSAHLEKCLALKAVSQLIQQIINGSDALPRQDCGRVGQGGFSEKEPR